MKRYGFYPVRVMGLALIVMLRGLHVQADPMYGDHWDIVWDSLPIQWWNQSNPGTMSDGVYSFRINWAPGWNDMKLLSLTDDTAVPPGDELTLDFSKPMCYVENGTNKTWMLTHVNPTVFKTIASWNVATKSVVAPTNTLKLLSVAGLTGLVARFTVPGNLPVLTMEGFSGCSSLREIVMNEGVVTISKWSFKACSGLTNIVMPRSVTTTQYESFYQSYQGLSGTVQMDSLVTLGAQTFNGCSFMTSFESGPELQSVGYRSFINCTALTGVVFRATNLLDMGYDLFSGCGKLKNLYFHGRMALTNSVNCFGGLAALTVTNWVERGKGWEAVADGAAIPGTWTSGTTQYIRYVPEKGTLVSLQ